MICSRSPEGKEGTASKEFAPREVFLNRFSNFISGLALSEEILERGNVANREQFVAVIRNELRELSLHFAPEEVRLFEGAFDLFSIKHALPPHLTETCEFLKGSGISGRISVEFGGPVAVSKTTIADFFSSQIRARKVGEVFTPEGNAFLERAYRDPGYMLRTQVGFWLNSVRDGLKAKYHGGRWTRDNSPLSDDRVFMEWRYRTGYVTKEEHAVYRQMTELLDPIVAKPNLLIMLIPNSIDQLWNGLQARIEADPTIRKMEKVISRKDLEIICQAASDAVEILRRRGIKVLELKVDPVRVFKEKELQYDTVYHIREELKILGELIFPPLEQVVAQISEFFAWKEGRYFLLYSPSMFTRKSTTLVEVWKKVGKSMRIFRPEKSKRRDLGETEEIMKTRDEDEAPVINIQSNNLWDVFNYIEKEKITSQTVHILAFDEAMLFENSPEEVVQILNRLRHLGFNILVTGVSLTFKGEAFSFMDTLLYWAQHDPKALALMMTTRCPECGEIAEVTRLTKDGKLADYHDPDVFIGDTDFRPTCGRQHKSCKNRPTPFTGMKDNLMPQPPEYYQGILEKAGVL